MIRRSYLTLSFSRDDKLSLSDDMASLVNRLCSITRVDGNPDITQRRAELNELISNLLPSEIRLLQHRLQRMTFVRDFVPDLPIEIRLGITDFLDLPDLTTFRNVSRRWYECWTQVSVCNKLMKEYSRSAFENNYMSLPDLEKRLRFMAVSERLVAMRDGHYNSMTILTYEPQAEQGDVPVKVLDRRYSTGRVAWAVEGGIKVSNLCSGTTMTYWMPDRDKVHFWSLSENLVVAGTPDKAKIYAWQLDGGRMSTARLPSLPSNTIATHQNRVGVVTSRREVLIWNIGGGSITQIAIQDPIPEHKGFRKLGIIFHPDSVDTTFIIFLSCQKINAHSEVTGTVQWRVQKYFHGELMATYKIEYPLEGLDYRAGDEPKEVFWLSPRKIDDNGMYSIGPVPVDFASGFLDLGCHHRWDRWHRQRGHRHLAHYITFDVYEERISTSFYHLPGGHKDQDYINFVTPQVRYQPLRENSHIWGRQIFLPLIKLLDPAALRDPREKLPIKKALLMAIKSCDQIMGLPTEVRYIGGYGTNPTLWTTKGRFPFRDLGVNYCWVGDPHLAQQNDPPGSGRDIEEHFMNRKIRGDGTFVVLFGEYDYVVWCYDKRLRVHGQE